MGRCCLPLLPLFLGLAASCLPLVPDKDSPEKSGTMLVPSNHFGGATPAPPAQRVAFSPAATETALRVDAIGRKIVAQNPQIGLHPYYLTAGMEQPEIFHQGKQMIYLTEGLVKQCRGD